MRFSNLAVFMTVFWSLITLGCGGGGSSKIGTTNFVGTQTPGDYWAWTKTTDASGGVTFTAINNTQGLNYSGSEIQLTGDSAGFSELNITSSNDTKISTPASAYTIEIPDTMVMAAVAPFYTFDHDGIVQLSVNAPVVAAAQGTCPSEGTTNINWIIMPGSNWCPTATAVIVTGSCSSASNAYGTAAITVSGGTYTVDVTPYHLDGSAGDQVLLSSCTCSEGVIQCSDSNTNTVRIAFTPSGIFIQDSASYGFAGVVQPASNITLGDFLKNGRSFKGMNFNPWDDFSQGCSSDSDCNGISGGTCLSGHCGIHETAPVSVTADGTKMKALEYTDIHNGTLSASGGTVNFENVSQPEPGLILATVTSSCQSTTPIVMVVTKIKNKYVAFTLTHSTCPTFDSPFNVLVVEQ